MRILLLLLVPLLAGPPVQQPPKPKKSARLDGIAKDSLKEALSTLAAEKWSPDQISVTVLDLKNPDRPEIGSHRGEVSYYPASVVKVCFMAASYEWHKRGKLRIDDKHYRDLQMMIGPSSNKATQRIVDRLSGTEDGPALSGRDWREFVQKRGAVNRWLHSLGLKEINACQKTYDGGDICPRDYQFLRDGKDSGPFTNRNRMNTDETAMLLSWIATGRIVDRKSCEKMLELMKRTLEKYPYDRKRTLGGTPEGSKVWSKAGWVDHEFHEASIVELPGGRKFVLVVFTEGKRYSGTLISEVSKGVCSRIVK